MRSSLRPLEFSLPSFLGVGLLVVACSGGSSDDDEDGNGGSRTVTSDPVEMDDLADALADAVCGGIADCCAAEDLPYDRATCETVLGQLYGAAVAEAEDSENYDPELAGQCVGAIGTNVEECSFDDLGGAACGTLFTSSDRQGRGEPCASSCMFTDSGSSCWIEGSAAGGCFVEDSLYCEPSASVCELMVELGSTCTTSRACRNGWCNNGICEERLPPGSACGFDDTACWDGYYCSFLDSSCTQKGEAGAACTSFDECLSDECAPNGTCVDGAAEAAEESRMFLLIACGD